MPNFRLQFRTEETVEGSMIRNGHERVIAAGDIQTARIVADAMLGEEVASSEYLAIVEAVEQTNEKPTLNCWTTAQENAVWVKVMKKVGLTNDEVAFICEGEKCIGLRITNPTKLTTKSSH